MENRIKIYQDIEKSDELYFVEGTGECEDMFDSDRFREAVDAEALAEEWKDYAVDAGVECEIIWLCGEP